MSSQFLDLWFRINFPSTTWMRSFDWHPYKYHWPIMGTALYNLICSDLKRVSSTLDCLEPKNELEKLVHTCLKSRCGSLPSGLPLLAPCAMPHIVCWTVPSRIFWRRDKRPRVELFLGQSRPLGGKISTLAHQINPTKSYNPRKIISYIQQMFGGWNK